MEFSWICEQTDPQPCLWDILTNNLLAKSTLATDLIFSCTICSSLFRELRYPGIVRGGAKAWQEMRMPPRFFQLEIGIDGYNQSSFSHAIHKILSARLSFFQAGFKC